MKTLFLLPIAIILSTGALFSQTRWEQTSANVSFKIKNRGSDVSGRFGGLKTSLVFSPDKLASSTLKGSVDVNSINTNNDKRDKDLKGDNYFDAGKYRLIEMSSTKIVRSGGKYTGTFNVTMKGVTKQVTVPFDFTERGNEAEFTAAFTINRRDFGVGGKGGLAMFMGDNATVNIDIKAKKGAYAAK